MTAINKRFHSLWIVLVIAAMLLPGCAPSEQDCTKPETFCVGLVTGFGKIDDGSLDQLAWDGLQQAGHDLGARVSYIQSVSTNDIEKNIETFARAGYDVIVTVGYEQKKVTIAEAKKYPSTDFIGVDQPQDPDKTLPRNLAGLAFSEEQAGFMAGALAAQMTVSKKVGVVCGPSWFPPALGYSTGFKAGANYVSPAVAATITCHNDLAFNANMNDPIWDALTANAMIDNGVDVVFGAAGLYNQNSALSTAAKRKVYAIGVEVDQYQTLGDARKTLLSSVVKQVAAGVFDLIKSAKQGTFQGGEFLGQVAYAPLHDLADRVPARVKSKMKQIQKKLADGTLDPENPNATPTPISPKAVKP